ncbi:MAG: ABC transporter permease subunit [Protaetiibacter sp.]
MSAINAHPGTAASAFGRGRPALVGAVASETVKLTTLRSNRVLAAAAFLMIVGAGVLQGLSLVSRLTDPRFAGQLVEARPMQFVDSVLWAQVLIAVIAVLAVTGEYGSGQIKVSLLATPTRLPVLAAKTMAAAALAFGIGAVGAGLALSIPLTFLPAAGIGYPIELSTGAGLALGSGAYLAAIAALATAIGMLVRNVIAGLAVTLPLVTILPSVVASIPVQVIRDAVAYFPTTAGRMLISDLPSTAALTPWQGYLVLLAWVVVLWATAAVTLRARDA